MRTNHWAALESSEEYVWCAALEAAFWEAEEEDEADFYFDWIECIDPQWAANLNGAGEVI